MSVNCDLSPKRPSVYLGNPILVVLEFRRSYNIFQAVITYALRRLFLVIPTMKAYLVIDNEGGAGHGMLREG